MTRAVAVFCVLNLIVSSVTASQLVTQPAGFNNGDPYRLVFVTDGRTDAMSRNAATYSRFVQREAELSAELSALQTDWSAIVSTRDDHARDLVEVDTELNQSEIPIFNLRGELVAASVDELWTGGMFRRLENSISYNQYGDQSQGNPLVWTGTDVFGFASLGGLGSPGFNVLGVSNSESFLWTSGLALPTRRFAAQLYGISGVLSASPVPSPETASLLCSLAAAGFMIVVLRRRRRVLCPHPCSPV